MLFRSLALDEAPHLVITGRVADPSLFLAPLVHRLGWARDDWTRLGAGTAVGHLLECSMQVTGGYFADPPHKVVPNIAHLGFPLAEVAADGSAVITKLDGTGGLVSELTVKEQLMYEVHNPAAYLTPDVTADFASAHIAQAGADRVAVRGVGGRERPRQLKAIVGFDGGFLAEGEISYAGPGAASRAQLAGEIVRERLASVHGNTAALRLDLIGLNALHGTAAMDALPAWATHSTDVRLRAALRTASRAMAENLLEEVESLWLGGPAGGGGYRGHITPSVTTQPVYVDRDSITLNIEVLQS